jgi:hypothetical protein
MAQFFLRLTLGVLVYVAFFYVLPSVLHLMGFNLNPDVGILLHVSLAFLTLGYAIWGKPVPTPW